MRGVFVFVCAGGEGRKKGVINGGAGERVFLGGRWEVWMVQGGSFVRFIM